MRDVILCLVLAVFVGHSSAQSVNGTWNIGRYPDPILYPNWCGREAPSFVCDPGNDLPIQKADVIDQLLKSIYNETNSGCYTTTPERIGYLVMLAVVPKMEKYFTQKMEDNMRARYREAVAFSYHLSTPKKWGNHSVNCNEMAVIIYAVKDNVLFTMTRSKIKEVLTNDKMMEITWDALGRYYPISRSPNAAADAITYMVREYRKVLKQKKSSQG